MKLILDIGCGNKKLSEPGYKTIGLDYILESKADVLADLNKIPLLPFKDNSFQMVYLSHVLEHISDPVKVIADIRRTVKNGGTVIIKVPHHSNYRAYEIHHKNYWNYFSLDPLCSYPGKSAEQKKLFVMKSKRIILRITKSKFRKIGHFFENIVNQFPYKYENYLHHFLPAYEIIFELEIIK